MSLRQRLEREDLCDLAEKLPFPTIEWHHVFATHQLMIRVNKQVAYDGPWNPILQNLLDGCTNATLVYAAIRGAFDGEEPTE